MTIYHFKQKEKRMKIEKCSDKSVYVTIDDWVFYIDNSTDEQIIEKWKENE